ncbi:Uncharacterized protein FVE85_2581 [Porphyridium purpureum]|uniref:Inorganic phosphate transport protein PHO88 n=1 Tax=Porphyridium purpureum TaxID=35688 RepID=A0A5J4YJI0_PORPP|nr:Uncharacterized protein FVE85_2581 [Porphyridium purpureum]|eukprot:POR0092..scf291_13
MLGLGNGVRDMVIVLGVMSYMKNLDQEDPKTLLLCRGVYLVYALLMLAYHLYLHTVVTKKNDQRKIKVPVVANPWSQAQAQAAAAAAPDAPRSAPAPPASPEEEEKTVRDYDMGILVAQRKALLTNMAMMAFVHFKMGSVSPLVVSSVMGILKVSDEHLFKLHVLGAAEEGKLERPFPTEPNPLMAMLGMGGEADKNEGGEESTVSASQNGAALADTSAADDADESEEEEQEEEEEEEEVAEEKNEVEKNEEDEEEEVEETTESKKDK